MSIRRIVGAGALAIAVGACGGSSPSEPSSSALSVSDVLQRLSQDAIQQGYLDQGLILGQAALASRFGVEPSVVPIKVGDTSLRYRGFVVVMTLPARDASPAFQARSFIGWSGEGDATKVMLVGSGADAASIVPLPDPGQGAAMPDIRSSAVALYMDGTRGGRWAGTSGSVRLVETAKGGACPQVPTGMSCTTASYALLLDGQLRVVPAANRNVTTSVSIQRTVVNAAVLAR